MSSRAFLLINSPFPLNSTAPFTASRPIWKWESRVISLSWQRVKKFTSLFEITFLAWTAPTSSGSKFGTSLFKKSESTLASASNTKTASPFANLNASFKTADLPGNAFLSLIKAFTLSCFCSNSLITSAVLSSLLSSITINSKFG